MSNYSLNQGLFVSITPTGAYNAVNGTDVDKPRQFLRNLLHQQQTPALTIENLQKLMWHQDEDKCLELLYHCQKLGWIQGLEHPVDYPEGALEDILPELLIALSENGKVLLADQQGFYLASEGFPHEVAEELSALSAEIATVHDRRSGLLLHNLGLGSQAWSVVDVFGNSQIGFWPLFIGSNRFVVAVSGIPHFNQPEFVSLVWALTMRYAPEHSSSH